MSGVVLIISIPTEIHEKCLLKKMKKKVVITDKAVEINPSVETKCENVELGSDGLAGSQELPVKIEHQSMEMIVRSTINELEVVDTTWRKTDDNNHYQIVFPIECGDKCDEILDILKENGIGNKLNSKISVLPCTIHYHGNELKESDDIIEEDCLANYKKTSGWNLVVSSLRSRLTVAQVVENVKNKAAMTFDFIILLMISTGEPRSLWVGAIIALLSGAAVALGILSDNIASLVGVAISTSLMPPAVNAGLLWSLGFVYYLKNDETTRYASLTHTDYFSTNSAVELTTLGAISLCLTFVNIVCIYAAGILVFMIKEVAPNTTRDQARKRFWKYDIKVARDYNKTIQSDQNIGCPEECPTHRQRNRPNYDLNHYSTDMSEGNFKPYNKQREFTWSPCLDHQFSSICSNTVSRHSRNQYRRLSQIFVPTVKIDDSLLTVHEKVSERTPLLRCDNRNTVLLSSGKKITITACDTP
ncbi:uncharacterized protein LOC109534530 isoform X2 [Dendroctonus ponderosae]|uniref:uncharacterized protein LOC109534530 isoform X2 n=1 Tax=Dendroctonus ponderosae TaxID=77166 RepID=UPI002035BE12|nr:uncharacterized protein LOC109534530 isoform X2 [Dendroctonus ponderosae]